MHVEGRQPGDAWSAALPRAARRARGVYFTPPALVDEVVGETLAPRLARGVTWRDDGSPVLRVLDPACGDGRFLAACASWLAAAAAGATGVAAARARAAIVRRCLVGVDRDAAAAGLARTALGEGADVRVGEALCGGVVDDGAWDAIVGNPPYVRSLRLRADDPALWRRLRGTLEATSHGEWDLYAAFIERALAWAAPGGHIGLVVPSRWLSARAAARLRGLLASRRAVRRVVDFGARQQFDGATTYTCLLYMCADGADAVDVDGGAVPAATLGAAPWVLRAGAAARRLDVLRAAGPPLGQIARIAKGAGTNADGVFLVAHDAPAGQGEPVRVPCVRGRDVSAYALAAERDALLPYQGGRLLAPAALEVLAPSAADHFNAHRAELEAREHGRFAGPTFYRWGRPQNLAWLRDRAAKIIVPDAACAGRAALDDAGRLVIDTAYAIRPLDPRAVPIGLLLAVLNAPVVAEWLGATGIPLRGGYFRMKTAYLASLPVPDPSTRAARALAADAMLATAADAAELGARVMRLYGS